MRKMRALLTALALVTALGAPGSAPAEGLDEIHRFEYTGETWVAYRVRLPQYASIRIDVWRAFEDARMFGDGLWILQADGTRVRSTAYAQASPGDEIRVRGPEPLGLVTEERRDDGFSRAYVGVEIGQFEAGEYVVVAFTASIAKSASGLLRFTASPGTSLLSVRTGSRTFGFDERDFDPETYVGVARPNAAAQTYANGGVITRVEGGLFAIFMTASRAAELESKGPHGTRTTLRDGDRHPTNPFGRALWHHGDPAGEYSFRIRAAAHAHAAGYPSSLGTILIGADVTLP